MTKQQTKIDAPLVVPLGWNLRIAYLNTQNRGITVTFGPFDTQEEAQGAMRRVVDEMELEDDRRMTFQVDPVIMRLEAREIAGTLRSLDAIIAVSSEKTRSIWTQLPKGQV